MVDLKPQTRTIELETSFESGFFRLAAMISSEREAHGRLPNIYVFRKNITSFNKQIC